MNEPLDDRIGEIPAWIEDEFRAELHAGRKPLVEDYAQRIPELFDEICEYLKVLQFTERVCEPQTTSLNGQPKAIGGYRIDELIGEGGMGTVYRASHPRLDRKVAIKILRTDRASQRPERFEREAATVSRLSHPNIVTLYDFGDDNGTQFLAMQWVAGFPLSEYVQSLTERRSEAESALTADHITAVFGQLGKPSINSPERLFAFIAKIGADIASALGCAHQQGAIHREIKPANLILDNDGKVWVTDFGLAKLRDDDSDLSRTGDMIGTPRYMAPEQIRGNADERSDIYSLGVTLWELATGKRAWEAMSQSNLVSTKALMELPEVLEMNSNVPAGLAGIIDKACVPSIRATVIRPPKNFSMC